MTPGQFTAAHEAMQEEKKIIEGKIEALKQRYIESLPFKVGDCVRLYNHGRFIHKVWITRITLVASSAKVNLTVIEPRKDGKPSKRERQLWYINPEDVELIKEEG